MKTYPLLVGVVLVATTSLLVLYLTVSDSTQINPQLQVYDKVFIEHELSALYQNQVLLSETSNLTIRSKVRVTSMFELL